MRRLFALCGILFLAQAQTAFATEWIAPHPLTHEQEIGFQKQSDHPWSAVVKGRGDVLHIRYSSPSPVDLFAVPLRSETEKHLGREILFAELAAGEHRDVLIDLSMSPRWSPLLAKQYVILKPHDTAVKTDIEKLEIGRTSPLKWPTIALRHLLIPQEFTASLYHAPGGYRMLNAPLGTLLGSLMLLVVIALFALRKRIPHWRRAGLIAIVVLLCAYQLRLSMDLVALTVHHADGWFTERTIDPVGSLPQVAAIMRGEADARGMDTLLLLDCTDDNEYSAKFLRYADYPLRVATKYSAHDAITHVFVHATAWNFANGTLTCENLTAKAWKIATLPDGSVLFSLTPSS